MEYTYEVLPRSAELGGGYRLQLFEDGVEVGGGVFPLAWADEPQNGLAMWDDMSVEFKAHWTAVAGSMVPADAWLVYLTQEALGDAVEEAEEWLATRPRNDA